MNHNVMAYIGDSCVLTSLGLGTDVNMAAMTEGHTGLAEMSMPRLSELPLPVQHIGHVECLPGLSRLETMFTKCISEVVSHSQVDVTFPRTAIIFSTTKGNISALGTIVPDDDSNVYLHNMASNVCRHLGIKASPVVVSNACISGVSALVIAQRYIRAGLYDNVIVAGGDEVTDFTTSGFLAFKSVSPRPCRPYDAGRDGLSLGEAVAAVLVTSDEQKSRGAVVEGGAMTNDANHISGPSRTGEPLAHAITQALADAHASTSDIAFLNAHGTATVYNDEMESKAINLAGLSSVPVNSLKPYFGHTLGASGLLEALIGIEELKSGTLLGTLGFSTLGTPMPLNVSPDNRPVSGHRFVKTASGFGGCNAAVVIAKQEYANASSRLERKDNGRITEECRIDNGVVKVNGKVVLEGTQPDFATFIREIYHSLGDNNLKFFKMNDMCKLGYVASAYLFKDVEINPYEVAIVMSNWSSSMDADIQHSRILQSGEPVSPAVFVYTLPNIVMGEMAIKHGVKGETTFLVDKADRNASRQYADILLSTRQYKHVICGWCEVVEGKYLFDAQLISAQDK